MVVSGSWFALRLVLWLCGSQVTLAVLVFWLELLVYGVLCYEFSLGWFSDCII